MYSQKKSPGIQKTEKIVWSAAATSLNHAAVDAIFADMETEGSSSSRVRQSRSD